MTGVFYLIAVFFFARLISFASYVIIKGFSGATPEMFRFLRKGSIGNQLFNTIYLVFIALVFSVPLGVTAGIYLSMYAKKGFLTRFLRICIETLSSLPSIVVGLFGYLVFLVFFGLGKSLLAGALSISILAIPVITTTTEDAINFRTWCNEVAIHLSRTSSSLYSTNYDGCDTGSRKRIW